MAVASRPPLAANVQNSLPRYESLQDQGFFEGGQTFSRDGREGYYLVRIPIFQADRRFNVRPFHVGLPSF